MKAPPPRGPGCPSELDLERWESGHAGARAQHAAHITGCASCAARLAWMAEVAQTFAVATYPRTREAVVERTLRRRFGLVLFLKIAVPIAAAACVVLLITRGPPSDYIGVKGDASRTPSLEVYVGDHDGQGHRVLAGEVVHPGDGLRFVVSGAQPRAFVFTIDALGKVSRIYPAAGEAPGSAAGLLPGGAILDGVSGPERVFAVFPRGPLQFSEVEAAALAALQPGADGVRALERLPLEVDQATVLLEKVPR